MEYIHYGSNAFNPAMVTRSRKGTHTKPDKGLWASPVNAGFGWKDWCRSEEYNTSSLSSFFKFELKKDVRILNIRSEEDILPFIWYNEDYQDEYRVHHKTSPADALNLDKLYAEYDGMELFLSDNRELKNTIFNTWDCDSIVVWNPDMIVVKKGEN